MNKPGNTDPTHLTRKAEAEAAAANKRQGDTLNRLRSALLADRLAVLHLSGENTGTDPYNSGGSRDPSQVWRRRMR